MIFGLLAAIGWGTTDFLGAVSGRRMGSLPALAISQLVGIVGATALFVAHGGGLASMHGLVWFLIANGVIAMIAYSVHYRALELGPVAVVSPVGAGYAVVGFTLAVLLLNEQPGPVAILGGVITIGGVFLVSANLPLLRAGLHERPPGLWWAVGSAVGFGLAGLIRRGDRQGLERLGHDPVHHACGAGGRVHPAARRAPQDVPQGGRRDRGRVRGGGRRRRVRPDGGGELLGRRHARATSPSSWPRARSSR